MKTLIIIPTYNEKANIKDLINKIFTVKDDLNILIVDDNSPDRTYEVVEELKADKYQDKLFLMHRQGKMGLASAYIDGFKWGLERGYNFLFEMDADFSHNPEYIPDFLTALTKNDLVLGSRYVSGGGVKDWGIIRRIISRGGSLYAKLILNLNHNDLTGGFKGFRREVLENINLDSIKSNGYSFQIELTYRAHLNGFMIKEIPIVFEDRTRGASKMSKKIFIEAILMVWWLRFHRKQLRE